MVGVATEPTHAYAKQGLNMADENVKTPKTCEQHPDQTAAAQCGACGKFICRDCIKQFGYYCSAACLESSRGSVSAKAKEDTQKARLDLQRAAKIGKLIVLGMCLMFALGAFWLVWKFFLDPSGKICWQWQNDAPLESMAILASNDKEITVLAKDKVVVLDPKKGTLIRSFEVPDDRPGKKGGKKGRKQAADDEDDGDDGEEFSLSYSFGYGSPPLVVVKDGSLMKIGASQVSRVTTDGKAKYTKVYEEGHVAHFGISPDHTVAYYVSTVPEDVAAAKQAKADLKAAREEYERTVGGAGEGEIPRQTEGSIKARAKIEAAYAVLQQTKTHIVAIDVDTGEERWTKKLKKQVHLYSTAAGADHFIGFFMTQPERVEATDVEAPAPEWTLCSLQAEDGKRSWQAKMVDRPEWGPQFVQGVTLLQMGNELQAITEDGTEKYTIAISGGKKRTEVDFVVREGLLFMVSQGGARCYDLETGKEKWGIAMSFYGDDLLVSKERIYVSGFIEEKLLDKDMKLPPAYEELKKTDGDLFKGFGGGGTKTIAIMVALDRETGKELWKLRNTYGWPRGDDKRFLLIADTARTSQMEMLTGGEGITVIRQFNARSGKELYMRRNNIGFTSPVLIGDRLIGLAFERRRTASLLNPAGGDGDDQPTKGLGVAAFKVR
ncbi:MAG: hypothetical protein A3K19_16845 [Lentisphaerae bacterium RIFOXYB12_FULL_65_16]|nr:MAG: hypothetical protein A3K18_19470 [Lentisphaerae bacterium RIFOXYA12_64_32]OGV88985.1 MAG: hypothetical protein A3K19_16845 [Lentisphaerae bacterium RIFOXYB12_FULL_65_16]